jgi:hypothetical protein
VLKVKYFLFDPFEDYLMPSRSSDERGRTSRSVRKPGGSEADLGLDLERSGPAGAPADLDVVLAALTPDEVIATERQKAEGERQKAEASVRRRRASVRRRGPSGHRADGLAAAEVERVEDALAAEEERAYRGEWSGFVK